MIVTAATIRTVESELVKMLKGFQKIEVAPLRKRVDEIPDLTKSIVQELCKTLGRKEVKVDDGTMRTLRRRNISLKTNIYMMLPKT